MYSDLHWLEKAAYTIHFCETCRLVSQRDIPDEFLTHRLQELRRLNDSARSSRDQTTRGDAAKRSTAIFLAAATAHLNVTALRTLRFGFNSRECLQTTTPSGASMQQMTASHWGSEPPEASEDRPVGTDDGLSVSFDVIHVGHELERSSDPRSVAMVLTRKLRAGGMLHVAVRNGARILRILNRFERDLAKSQGRTLHALMPLEELNCFCPETLIYLAGQCGLERLRPSWRSLFRAYRSDAGGFKALLPTVVHLCSLRGRHSTDLLFRKSYSIHGENRHRTII